MLSEIRQKKTNYVITYMWNIKKNKTMNVYKTETYRYREQISGYQWEEERAERGKIRYEIKRYKLLHIK